ncbi:hypothetical protein AX17_005184 [Amanita inopinata Kibby_2008]|nr:hypothetical protein AX17_005184 [Amanita inopinata Kibby_2008]
MDSTLISRNQPETQCDIPCSDFDTTPLIPASFSNPLYVNTPSRQRKVHKKNPKALSLASDMGNEIEAFASESRGSKTPDDVTFRPCTSKGSPMSTVDRVDKDDCDRYSAHARASSGFTFRALMSRVSLMLENSGSVARDHLASERTFLAYMRTSLAIVTAGVALVQLLISAGQSPNPVQHASLRKLHITVRSLGASAIILGLIVLIIGVTRYFVVQAALTKGMFPAARVSAGVIAVALSVLVSVTFSILLAGKLEV